MAAHQAPPSLGFSRQEHGVGCHFRVQCMKVKSESEVTQLCLTLSDPMDCGLPGSSVHGIFLEWGAIAFSDTSLYSLFIESFPTSGFLHSLFILSFFFKFYFIFKLYIIVLVLPNIKMNPPQVCIPSKCCKVTSYHVHICT